MFAHISILAPGLLGASLGQAVAEQRLADRCTVWARRPEARLACAEASWCDAALASPEEAVAGADLVVVCTPVASIVPMVERVAGALAPGAIVTDVGSTKSLICRHAQPLLGPGQHFVGAHPMAGSERTGMAHARADLFHGRPCFVTPLPETDAAAVERVVRFWSALDLRVTTLSPEKHDEIVAAISHLPHLTATALCLSLRAKEPSWASLAGNGLRDTTRIAAGHPGLWRDICEQNRDEILRSLRELEDSLHDVRAALENRDFHRVEHLLELGRQYRQSLGEPSGAGAAQETGEARS